MVVSGVPISAVPYMWPHAKPHIEAALEHAHGELNADDVHERLLDGRMQLICAGENGLRGVCVIEPVTYPRTCRIRIVTVGGKHALTWAGSLRDYLLDRCREEGFSGIEGYSRTDSRYLKLLERIGAKRAYVVTLMELPQ